MALEGETDETEEIEGIAQSVNAMSAGARLQDQQISIDIFLVKIPAQSSQSIR
jgi:hypothetical protein